MLKVAYLFPGQGAQYVGMGQDFCNHCPQAREVFEQAAQALGFDLTKLCFQGPASELAQTENCQIAIFVTSLACLRALEQTQLKLQVKFAAGLSLGEYTALMAGGAFKLDQAFKLVQLRGKYMQQASEKNKGGMLSLIGLPLNIVEQICQKAEVEVANLNSPQQIVISGPLANLEQAKGLAVAEGVRNVIPLQVSGGFHSSLMNEAAGKLTEVLGEIEISSPRTPVISNVTARQESSPEEIKDNLARQVVCRTRWEDSVRYMVSCGIDSFLEIGPGKVLKGLLRKIDPQLQVYNIENNQDLERFKEEAITCY